MKVLITGGAGYIGSHAVRYFIENGHDVVAYDNLSKGHRQAVDSRALFIHGDVTDQGALASALNKNRIEAVLHFAAVTEVAESIQNPGKYIFNNVHGTLQLLRAMEIAQVKKIVFSSTAAVYGNSKKNPILETTACAPINPYGRSKWMSESMIQDFHKAHGISYAILRYFNVAGAWPDGSIGEDHNPETHLIPKILKNRAVQIYGDNYPTRDGTCVRDYLHVIDLVAAHLLALENLSNDSADIMNVGSETGYSVKEVITASEKVLGKKISVSIEKRRDGDPDTLIANSEKIRKNLNWKRQYPSLEDIIKHAWFWHSQNPMGYQSRKA